MSNKLWDSPGEAIFKGKKMKDLILFSSFLFVFISLLSGCNIKTETPPQFAELEMEIDSLFKIGDLVGLSTCILKDDEIIWSNTMGMADIEKNIPVTNNTLFTLASLSKTVTGTALMHLYDQGAFELDDDINEYIPFKIRNPRFPDLPITIRMVLTHTSSLKDNDEYVSSLYGCGDQTELSFEEYLKNCYDINGSNYDTLNFSDLNPGGNEDYANSNYVLVAYLVEILSHQSFSTYCHENLFAPLEMNETGWLNTELDITKLARQYISQTEAMKYPNHPRIDKTSIKGKTGVCNYSWPGYPDGSLKTSIPQFANFVIMMMNIGTFKGKQILKPETVSMILTPQNAVTPSSSPRWDKIDIGLTWFYRESKSEKYFMHTGGGTGITTMAFFNPEKKIGAIFFITGDWHDKEYDRLFFDIFRKNINKIY